MLRVEVLVREHPMKFSRRKLLQAGGVGAAMTVSRIAQAQLPQQVVPGDFKISKGRIRQSVMGWCFKPMTAVELARHCKEIGLVAIEGISPSDYSAVRDLGLQISLVSSHGFARGPFSRANYEFCTSKLRESIDLAALVGCPSVITFTGMREKGATDEQGIRNCLDCWKQVIGYAEQKKV